MSDKIKKFLAKLSARDLSRVRDALCLIESGDLSDLDAKSLKGKSGYIWIRVGRIRIICLQRGGDYEILHITNRNEKTYKNL